MWIVSVVWFDCRWFYLSGCTNLCGAVVIATRPNWNQSSTDSTRSLWAAQSGSEVTVRTSLWTKVQSVHLWKVDSVKPVGELFPLSQVPGNTRDAPQSPTEKNSSGPGSWFSFIQSIFTFTHFLQWSLLKRHAWRLMRSLHRLSNLHWDLNHYTFPACRLRKPWGAKWRHFFGDLSCFFSPVFWLHS